MVVRIDLESQAGPVSGRLQSRVFDPIPAEILRAVEEVIRFLEDVGGRSVMAWIKHRQSRADSDYAEGAPLMWNRQTFNADPHSLNSHHR